MRSTVHVLPLSCLLIALGACGDPVADECNPVLSVVATPTTFMSGDLMRFDIDALDFTLVNPATEDTGEFDEKCVGHYRVYLDDLESDPIYKGFVDQVDVVVDGEPGDHSLEFRLHDQQGAPITPPWVTDTVKITIQ